MKKFASVFLALIVVLSMFTFVTSAVNVPKITMTADKTVADIGDVITVTVSISPKSKLCSLSVDMTFSPTDFEVVSATAANSSGLSNINYSSNKVRYGFVTATSIADNETALFKVQLKIKAKNGKINLNVTEAYCDDNGDAIDVTNGVKASIGSIKISAPSGGNTTVPDKGSCENGHKAGAMVTKVPATATTDGSATISCIYCNKVLSTEVLPMLGDARNPVIPHTDAD